MGVPSTDSKGNTGVSVIAGALKSLEIGNEVLAGIWRSVDNLIDSTVFAVIKGVDGGAKCRAETNPGNEHENPIENIEDENEAYEPVMFHEF